MKNSLRIVIVSFLGFYFYSCSAQTSEQTIPIEWKRVPGTGIFLDLPETFIHDTNTLSAYIQPKVSSISVDLIQNDYDKIRSTSNWDFYKNRGDYVLIQEKPIEISGFKGFFLEMDVKGQLRMISVLVGDRKNTYRFYGECHKLNKEAIDQLKHIFESAKIDPDFEVPWNDEIRFSIKETYDGTFSIKENYSNRIKFKLAPDLMLDGMRLLDVPNSKKDSKSMLVQDGLAAWGQRKELQITGQLAPKDTSISNHSTLLIEKQCKKSNKEVILVQCIMEGRTQRILFTSIIQNNFVKNKEEIYDFLNHLVIE